MPIRFEERSRPPRFGKLDDEARRRKESAPIILVSTPGLRSLGAAFEGAVRECLIWQAGPRRVGVWVRTAESPRSRTHETCVGAALPDDSSGGGLRGHGPGRRIEGAGGFDEDALDGMWIARREGTVLPIE
jgi:hypothetical protein